MQCFLKLSKSIAKVIFAFLLLFVILIQNEFHDENTVLMIDQ